MSQYFQKIFTKFLLLIIVIAAAFVNWMWPLYVFFNDTPVYRFIWLGIFFVLLDVVIEVALRMMKEFGLIADSMSLSRDIRKLSDSFRLASKISLPNKLKADYVVVGSSGVWLVIVKDDKGKITFNGDELVQDQVVLGGLLTQSLEKAYTLAGFIKQNLNHEFTVTPVIVFSSSRADLGSAPKNVRGVYLSLRKDLVSIIENTDVQLIDKNTIEEIYKLLQK